MSPYPHCSEMSQKLISLSATHLIRLSLVMCQPFLNIFRCCRFRMSDPDLERFLSQVDEVNDVIQGLSVGDESASQKADQLLQKNKAKAENVGFNSCRINKISDSG